MNDGKVTAPSAEGALFRLDPDLQLHRMVEGVTIPNGIGWNVADDTMFWTDSPTGNIYKFDFDAETGNISNQRVHFHLEGEPEGAEPDGFALDAEGCLWTAVYGGGKVLRLSPEGKVIGIISLPTPSISCPCFAGEELYITSAEEKDPENYPDSEKYAGSLFRVNVGVRGLPVNKFKGRRA